MERVPGKSCRVASFQYSLRSWRSRFKHQGRNELETGSINLPGKVKANRQQAQASFLHVILTALQPEGVDQIYNGSSHLK